MNIYEKTFEKANINGCVLALGNFDGVHIGHRFLLDKAREYAKFNNLAFGVYTFVKHPKLLFGKKHEMLTSIQEKLSILSELDVDFVYLESFEDVKDMLPHEFAEMIVEKFDVRCTFCGENFTFGKGASGTPEMLLDFMIQKGRESVAVEGLEIDGTLVSSTVIRGFLQIGNAQKAHELLGEPYGFTSRIIHGARLGRTLGFPTINQQIPEDKIVPAFGVYCSVVIIDGKEYMGVTDIGVKPTVSGDERQILAETHIIDFDDDVYEKDAGILLVKKLRDEKKFSTLSELQNEISKNVEQTKEFFKVKYEK